MKVNAINGINQSVSFEKRNKRADKAQAQHQTNPMKAVPLAVLIAMSPITTNAKNIMHNDTPQETTEFVQSLSKMTKTVTSRRVLPDVMEVGFKHERDVTVLRVDTDGNKSDFEKLYLKHYDEAFLSPEDQTKYDFYDNVKSLNNYSFNVLGDDGKSYGTLKYSQLILESEISKDGKKSYTYISSPKIIEEVLKDMNSPANNTDFRIKSISKNILQKRETGLTGYKKLDTSWIQKVKQIPYNFGTQVLAADINTQVGNYKISGFSNDGNSENFEVLVFERNDGLKFKLDGLRQLDMSVETNDGHKETISLYCIDISWPKVGKFTIYDDELFGALLNMAQQDKDNNKAISVSLMKNESFILDSGPVNSKSTVQKIL